MWKRLGITLLVAGLSAMTALAQDATAVPAQTQAEVKITGGDVDSLQAFILRYLIGNQQNADVEVMIATMPADLPVPLTAPSDAILYGTVKRHDGQAGPGTYYDVAYDTAQTPAQVVEFYKQAYSGADWKLTSESSSPPAAFSGQSSSYTTFCYQEGIATINVNAFTMGTGPTNMNITVQVPGDPYMCSSTDQGMSGPLFSLIPSLALPDGVSVISNMNGGFSYYTPNTPSTSFGAILETSSSLVDLAANYNAQLAAKGWQQVSVENSDHVAFSTWMVTDESGKVWHGTLLIVTDVTPNRYNALIYVEE